MYSTLPETSHGSLGAMVRMEARRFARHPLFIVGFLAAMTVMLLFNLDDSEYFGDALSTPVTAAFFIGLPSLVVAARLVRSTEAADEAMAAVPGTEARRTLAVAGACVVPFAAGLVWLATLFVGLAIKAPHPNELWFGTLDDVYVWSLLVALGPVACLGGGLLGVLVGRWLRFRGAPAVAVVALLAFDLLWQVPFMGEDVLTDSVADPARYRLFVPWAMWHSGTTEEGLQALGPGNPVFYLLYLLGLCALAVGGAVWHDRTARTTSLRVRLYALLGLTAVLLALAMLTGTEGIVSEPVRPPRG